MAKIKPLISTKITTYNPAWGRNLSSSGGQFSSLELMELKKIRFNLIASLDIEKEQTKYLGDRILKFARSEEKKKLKGREAGQESKKGGLGNFLKSASNNPIAKKALSGLNALGNFFQGIVKTFITYKILEWVAKPENTKKVTRIVEGISGIISFLGKAASVLGFVLQNNPITWAAKLTIEGVKATFSIIGNIINFFGWIGDTLGNVGENISNLFSVFNLIPQAIDNFIGFFTQGIPKFLENILTEGLFGSQKDIEGELKSSDKPKESSTQESGAAPKVDFGKLIGDKAKDAIGNIGKTLLGMLFPGANIALDIGSKVFNGIKGLFGGDKQKENIPKLAKGGIVTKPTQAIVGEAGPEAILPLSKLDSFIGEGNPVNKIIPKFMKLLTVPFTVIGAGIVALISTSLSAIPGIGPLIAPLIASVSSAFGLPPSMVAGLTKFGGKALKSLSSGMGGIAELFGSKEPNIVAKPGGRYTPTKDNTVRGLLGNILNILITKTKKSSDNNTTPSAPPPATNSGAEPGATPGPKVGGSTKPLSENTSLAKAGDAVVQNLAGTQSDLMKKGYKYVPNTANRFWQDAQGRLYQATPSGTTLLGEEKFTLKAVTQEQIDKGFSAAGSEHTLVGSRNNREIQRQLELFRIINRGGILEKETTGSQTQVKQGNKWTDKGSGGPVSTRKFMKLGGGWAPIPDDSPGAVLGRGSEHGYAARDIPMPVGTPLLSPFDGKVHEISKNPGGWGNFIVLKSNNGIFSLFGHVSSYTKKQGDSVKAGEQVASSGHQHGGGRSTGPHLHWEIGSSWNGTIGNKVEPIAWTRGKATPSVSGQTSSTASTDTTSTDENNTSEPSLPDFASIISSLQGFHKAFVGSTAGASLSASTPASSTALQSSQQENNRLQSQSRTSKPNGNVVTLGNPNRTIQSSSTQTMTPSLGNNLPPQPLVLTSTKP